MNTWSGVSNFGGGPPSQDATSVYDWVKFYAGATSIPVDGGSTGGTGSVSINDVTISEGNILTKVATLRHPQRRHGSIRRELRHLRRAATAADGDYAAASNTLHFGANQNTQTSRSRSTATPRSRGTRPSTSICLVRPTAPPSATLKVSAPLPTMIAHRRQISWQMEDLRAIFSGWTLSGNSSGNQIYIAPTAFPGEVHTGSYSAGLDR